MSKRDSDKRRLERRLAERTMLVNTLIAAGKSCGNCKHFEKMPGPGNKGRFICYLNSDHRGYQITTADNLCHQHERKP